MKRNLLFMAVASAALLFSSCNDDDDNNAGGVVGNSYLNVTINGTQKSFSDVRGRWVDGGNFLEINATNTGEEWVSITVLNETTRVPAGTYTLNDGSPFTILSVYGDGQLNYTATKNTLAVEDAFNLNISKIDNAEVEGTFSGVLVRVNGETTLGTTTLQNGSFKTSIAPN